MPNVSAQDFVAIRHGLHKKTLELNRSMQGLTPESERWQVLKREKEETERAYNANLAREQAFYKTNPGRIPTDWNKKTNQPILPGQVGGPSIKEMEKWVAKSAADIPEPAKVFPKAPTEKETYQKVRQRIPKGERAKDKFIRRETERSQRRLDEIEKKLSDLDPRKTEDYEKKKADLDTKRDEAVSFNDFIKDLKEKEFGPQTYDAAVKKLKDSFTPEQEEKYKRGEKVGMTKEQALLMRDMDKIHSTRVRDLQDEQDYLAGDPSRTHAMWRGLPPEEKAEEVEDIRQDRMEKKITEGTQDQYYQNKKDEDPPFDELPLERRKQERDLYVKKNATPLRQSFGGKAYDALFGGGGEEFISKYPPELRKPIIRATKRSLSGLGQLGGILQGRLAESQLPQAMMGLMEPQEGPPYQPEFETQFPVEQLLQQLSQPPQPFGQQQQQSMAPTETPGEQKSMEDILLGLKSDLGGLLQNRNQ